MTHKAVSPQENTAFQALLFCFEIFLIIIYAIWIRYESSRDDFQVTQEDVDNKYGYFRDVNIMIFFGFGFLMTFLKRYAYSALGYTFLISALVCQWALPLVAFFETVYEGHGFAKFGLDMHNMLDALFCAGAVMISYGAVLGKVSPLQMLVVGIIEPIFYFLNVYIGAYHLEAVDVGGGMFIHTFGCYFGLALALFLTNRETQTSPDNAPLYNNDLFSFAGTIFLWIMWPSFNAAIAPEGDPQLRALINTFISLTGSTVAAFLVSRMVSGGKFEMVHIQNSTLAGGVAMGVIAHLNITPAAAMGTGFISGVVSVLGYKYLTPYMSEKLSLQDVCGIHNLHGMPGVIGSLAAVFATLHAAYDPSIHGSEEQSLLIFEGKDQAGRNAAALFISIGLGVAGGLFTGIILKSLESINGFMPGDYFNDDKFWEVPADYTVSGSGGHGSGGKMVEMDNVTVNHSMKNYESKAGASPYNAPSALIEDMLARIRRLEERNAALSSPGHNHASRRSHRSSPKHYSDDER